MKLVTTDSGRAALQFVFEEIRPLRGLALSIAVAALKDRYKFEGTPNFANRPWKDVENSPIEFNEGVFRHGDSIIPILRFTLYTDAIAVDCRTTDDAELVLNDIVQWARETLGFREFQKPPTRIFASAIVVEFGKPLEGLLSRWGEFQEIFWAPIRKLYEIDEPIGMFRLAVGCDPIRVSKASIMSDVHIERRTKEPFSSNRYFCTGPLRTREMIAALEALEALIS